MTSEKMAGSVFQISSPVKRSLLLQSEQWPSHISLSSLTPDWCFLSSQIELHLKKKRLACVGRSAGQNGNENRKFLFWAVWSPALVGTCEAEWPSFSDVPIEASTFALNNRRSCCRLLWHWIKQTSLWPEVRRLLWFMWTFEAADKAEPLPRDCRHVSCAWAMLACWVIPESGRQHLSLGSGRDP